MTDTVNAIIDERAATHGDPVLTHIRIAQVWSAILDHEVSAHEVALCMAGLKLVRSANNPDHQDSRDDAQGYVRIADLIAGPEEAPAVKVCGDCFGTEDDHLEWCDSRVRTVLS